MLKIAHSTITTSSSTHSLLGKNRARHEGFT
jgi:hypothetical protein